MGEGRDVDDAWPMDTALHLHTQSGRADAVKMLLRHGANTEIRNAKGLTPLLLAVQANQLPVVQVLLQHGAKTEALAPLTCGHGHCREEELGTCVHIAAAAGHLQILRFLVTAAALDANQRTCGRRRVTALHLAARRGRADVVRFLSAQTDVDTNTRDAQGMTPLHHACDHHNTADDDVDASAPTRPQYLADAAFVDVVDALVRADANVDARRADDQATPLDCAIEGGHFLLANALVAYGAHSRTPTWLHKLKTLLLHPKSKCPPASSFVPKTLRRSPSLLDTVLSTGEDPIQPFKPFGQHQDTRLLAACQLRSLRRLREALSHDDGDVINSHLPVKGGSSDDGWTALHLASASGWQRGVTFLLAHGADVKLTTTRRRATALHLAAQNGHNANLVALLTAGADINARDALNTTPLLTALRHGRSRTVHLLLRHGADASLSPQQLETPEPPQKTTLLHVAAFSGALPLIQSLVRSTSNDLQALDAEDADGATAAWLAALLGHVEVLDFLAKHGANLHHQVAGVSLARCAAEFGHLEVLEYLSTSSPGHQLWTRRSLTRLALDRNRSDRRKSV
ncbi:hypothetical protein BBJ28_00002395 [Nothophytophthora sp. Chile5]|nr:hypothetical protein BBJ28_00002395 [Nothophytophthora sp. Chile5]